jgi:tRNA1Val (adenine37-N6)-methyltransferase
MTNIPKHDSSLLEHDETIDAALGDGLKIIQKTNGYRYSLDAFLLAHFTSLKKNDRILDLGTGSGIISLVLAKRWGFIKIIGIEIQEELAAMARRSAELNNLKDRVDIIQGDVRKIDALCAENAFDLVVSNPPYRKLHSGRINSDAQKASARHEIEGSLIDFLGAAQFALKKKGHFFLIYPATRMVELLYRMRKNDLEPKKLRMVHSKNRSEGELVLVEGVKGGREELHILPPLYVYDENGVYTEEIAAIFEVLSRPAFP